MGQALIRGDALVVRSGGAITCSQAVQDYVPVQPASLTLWTDFGDPATRSGTTFARRPATIATGQGSLLTDNAFSVSDQFLTAKQNGRGILLLGRGGGGLSAVWGPMSAGWPGR